MKKSSFKRNFKTWKFVTVCLSAVILLGFASNRRTDAQAGSTYTVTDLGTIGGTQSRAYGINNAGDIVGDSYPASSSTNHPFQRKTGTSTLIDIGTFNGDSTAYAVNSTTYTVGYSTSVSGQRAFLWHDDNNNGISDGAELQNFMPAGAIGVAYDINDSNKVVGVIDASGGSSLGQNGYVWDSTSGLVILSGSATVVPETAFGINNAGAIVGEAATSTGGHHAFLLKNNSYLDLGTLTGSGFSFAREISEDNHVVGYSQTPTSPPSALNPNHGFMWFDANNNGANDAGEMKDLGTFSGTNLESYAFDINANEQIVGRAEVSSGNNHAVVWHDDNCDGVYAASEMKDLNGLISDATWTLQEAQSINDSGQIVGFGLHNGVLHAFLLTPTGSVPGPCSTPTPSPSPTPTTTTIINVSGSGTFGGTATLTATLMSNSSPVSGKTISFTVDGNGVCGGGQPACPTTNASGIATMNVSGFSAGNHPIVASFAGDASYSSSNGNGTLAIGKATPTITWNNPADIVYGTALSGTQLNATASVPGTFVYTPLANTVLQAGLGQTLHVDFNPTDSTNYNMASKDVFINVNKATLTITADAKSKTYRAANPTLTFTPTGFVNSDTSAVLSGAPSLTTTATTTSNVGGYTITAAQGTLAAADYTFSFVNGTLTINKATPLITWNNPADITYGTALSGTQLNATAANPNDSSNVAGSFTYTPPSGTVLHAGNGQTLRADFAPTDTTNYDPPTQKTVSINVVKATLTITADNKARPVNTANPTFTYTPSGFVNGDSSGVLTGSPNLSTTATQSSPAGDYPITITQGTLAAGDYAFTFVNGTLSVGKVAPVINWSNPANIVYGTALSGTQLNATATDPNTGASVAGTFTYSPVAGTVLHAGNNQTLAVTFNPTDTTNYSAPPQKTVTINVLKAALTITADNKVKVVGTANPSLTFTPSGFVNGDSAGVLSGAPSLSTTATTSSPIGAYPITITQGSLGAADYAFTFVNGTLTVTEAAPVLFIETGTEASPIAAAVDSVTYAKGPFRVAAFVNFSSDHITRVIVFTAPLANPDSTLKVFASGTQLQIENVGTVTGTPGLSASYIVFKLDPILTGSGPIDYDLTVQLRGINSNAAKMTIIP